nr:hypothetical protein Q903MT_gene639 [Picea sitchensis]
MLGPLRGMIQIVVFLGHSTDNYSQNKRDSSKIKRSIVDQLLLVPLPIHANSGSAPTAAEETQLVS